MKEVRVDIEEVLLEDCEIVKMGVAGVYIEVL